MTTVQSPPSRPSFFRLLCHLLLPPSLCSVCVQTVHSVLLCVCVRAKLYVLQVLLQLGSAKWLKMCVPYATFGHENFATILVAFTLLI